MQEERIRVYVADRHGMSRYGIVHALIQSDQFELVGESVDGRAAALDIGHLEPDVAVVSERLPPLTGLELLRAVRQECRTRIVLVSADLETRAVYAALVAGASGYLSCDTTEAQLREVVGSVAQGTPMLAPEVQRTLLEEIHNTAEPPILSKREREVLTLLADGRGASQIATDLQVGVSTVKKHLGNLYFKLEAPNSAAAVARAMRLGVID